ncbi:UNVERIFIED_ORG: hypothetical protein ABID57_000678 [Arthrobacter sp. UYEF1]
MAMAAGIALGALVSGCSSGSTTPAKPAPTVVAPVADDMPVANSQRSKDASTFVRALSLGGDATAMKIVSPSAHFNYNKVMKGLKGCRLSTSWYGSGSTISGDVDCSDGDVVAVDITFDSSNRVTRLTGQGVTREFDSAASGI